MGLNCARDWTRSRIESIKNKVKQNQHQFFMEAVVAGCATVAFADNLVRDDEISKIMEFFRLNDILSVFDAGTVLETFETYIEQFLFDAHIGRDTAFKAIRKVRSFPDEARMVVLVCGAVAESDDEYLEDEKKAVRQICQHLGLDVTEFNLHTPAPHNPPIPTDFAPEWMCQPPAKPSNKGMPAWMQTPQ